MRAMNGLRGHLPLLLALSANSPFWRGDTTGLASTRTPIFRAFPRTGMPPTYRDWRDYEQRIEFMVGSGAIEDYTYLWYDVRPHPAFGTVEVVVERSTRRRVLWAAPTEWMTPDSRSTKMGKNWFLRAPRKADGSRRRSPSHSTGRGDSGFGECAGSASPRTSVAIVPTSPSLLVVDSSSVSTS